MNKTIWRGDLDDEIPLLWDNEIPEPLQPEVPGKATMSWPKNLQETTTACGDGAEGHRELHSSGGAAGK